MRVNDEFVILYLFIGINEDDESKFDFVGHSSSPATKADDLPGSSEKKDSISESPASVSSTGTGMEYLLDEGEQKSASKKTKVESSTSSNIENEDDLFAGTCIALLSCHI